MAKLLNFKRLVIVSFVAGKVTKPNFSKSNWIGIILHAKDNWENIYYYHLKDSIIQLEQ